MTEEQKSKFRNQSLFKAVHLKLMLPIKLLSLKKAKFFVIFKNKQPILSWLQILAGSERVV